MVETLIPYPFQSSKHAPPGFRSQKAQFNTKRALIPRLKLEAGNHVHVVKDRLELKSILISRSKRIRVLEFLLESKLELKSISIARWELEIGQPQGLPLQWCLGKKGYLDSEMEGEDG